MIDLHPAPALEVLGVKSSAKWNLARGGRLGRAHGKHGSDGKIIRRTGPIDAHVSLAGGIETQIPVVAWDHALKNGGQADAVNPGANAHDLSPRRLRRAERSAVVKVVNGGVDSATLPRAGDQIRQRDLIGSNVQASGRVHAINPEVFDGVAGVDHFSSAVQ